MTGLTVGRLDGCEGERSSRDRARLAGGKATWRGSSRSLEEPSFLLKKKQNTRQRRDERKAEQRHELRAPPDQGTACNGNSRSPQRHFTTSP